MDFWQKHSAESIKEELAALPKAELRTLYAETEDTMAYGAKDTELVNAAGLKKLTDKAVFVEGEHIANVSKGYELVQHETAFAPIVDNLEAQGTNKFKFTVWANHRRAFLGVLVGEAKDSVQFGFRCTNSVDGSGSINYGLKASRVQTVIDIVEKEHVTVWGIRQVCNNGCIIKIPLKSIKYLDAVTSRKVQELAKELRSIRHTKGAYDRMAEVRLLVESFLALEKPINAMIGDAQNFTIKPQDVQKLLKFYVGERMAKSVELEFAHPKYDGSLWALYNATTAIASHNDDYKDGTRNSLLDKAGNLLTGALINGIPVIEVKAE